MLVKLRAIAVSFDRYDSVMILLLGVIWIQMYFMNFSSDHFLFKNIVQNARY